MTATNAPTTQTLRASIAGTPRSNRHPPEIGERIVELEKLNREKTRWLSAAAHDLRQPAGAILVYTELLMEEGAALSEEHKAILESIHTSCEFMLHMLSDIADIAVSDSEMAPMDFQATDLRFLMEQSITLSRPVALRRDTELALRYQEPIPEVAVDRWKMQQVLTNLIGNAIQYSQPGAKVEVGAALDQGGVLLWVRDDGPGIAADEIDQIFVPFQRTRRRRASAGLGLSICKYIVERHGGRIWVESALGQGAAFYLTLPVNSNGDFA